MLETDLLILDYNIDIIIDWNMYILKHKYILQWLNKNGKTNKTKGYKHIKNILFKQITLYSTLFLTTLYPAIPLTFINNICFNNNNNHKSVIYIYPLQIMVSIWIIIDDFFKYENVYSSCVLIFFPLRIVDELLGILTLDFLILIHSSVQNVKNEYLKFYWDPKEAEIFKI